MVQRYILGPPAILLVEHQYEDPVMKEKNPYDDHHCSVIEKKRLDKDLAHCDATHDSESARNACYTKAREASERREFACKNS